MAGIFGARGPSVFRLSRFRAYLVDTWGVAADYVFQSVSLRTRRDAVIGIFKELTGEGVPPTGQAHCSMIWLCCQPPLKRRYYVTFYFRLLPVHNLAMIIPGKIDTTSLT